jgi:hypothetical protein
VSTNKLILNLIAPLEPVSPALEELIGQSPTQQAKEKRKRKKRDDTAAETRRECMNRLEYVSTT